MNLHEYQIVLPLLETSAHCGPHQHKGTCALSPDNVAFITGGTLYLPLVLLLLLSSP